jgi:hypothetical protein
MGDDEPKLDAEHDGVWAWAVAEAQRVDGKWWVSLMLLPVIAAYVGTRIRAPQTPTWSQQFWAGVLAAACVLAFYVVVGLIYTLVIAPYQQRNQLRLTVGHVRGEYEASRAAEVELAADSWSYDATLCVKNVGPAGSFKVEASWAEFEDGTRIELGHCRLPWRDHFERDLWVLDTGQSSWVDVLHLQETHVKPGNKEGSPLPCRVQMPWLNLADLTNRTPTVLREWDTPDVPATATARIHCEVTRMGGGSQPFIYVATIPVVPGGFQPLTVWREDERT